MKARRPRRAMISWNMLGNDDDDIFVVIAAPDHFDSFPFEYLRRLVRKNSNNYQQSFETCYIHAFYAVEYNGEEY